MTDSKTLLIVVVVIAAAILIYFVMRKDKEGYVSGHDLDNIGVMEDQVQLTENFQRYAPETNFADLVYQDLDTMAVAEKETPTEKPMERLQRLQGDSLMPRVSSDVTPYNIDVANPSTYSTYLVNPPRVDTALKSRYKDYSLYNFIRGDVVPTIHPNIPLVSKTVQGFDDIRLDAYFSPQFNSLYNRYTGKEFRNMPIHVAGAGQAGGYGGASGEILMDS
jgi:hypothetical protein